MCINKYNNFQCGNTNNKTDYFQDTVYVYPLSFFIHYVCSVSIVMVGARKPFVLEMTERYKES